jgi:hypothetical protein
MTIDSAGWRTLDAGELAAEPDARLGGALAVMFGAAVFALTPIAFLAFSSITDSQGTTWVMLMMLRQAFGGDMKSAYFALSLVQMLTLLAWAATFVVVTLARARSGPGAAATAFAIATTIGPLGQCALIIMFAGEASGILAATAQLPYLVLNLVAAVAFWAYMSEGRRPNLYFRRRLRVA